MWFFKNTFGIITLRVGIISFSSVFITLAACILLVNILSLDKEEPTGWMIMFMFTFTMIIIWSIASIGAFYESKRLIFTATILWAGYLALWLVLVVWSFIQPNKNICIGDRCPNVLWLMDNTWNDLQYGANENKKFHNYGGLLRQDENTQSKCTNICLLRKTLIDKMRTNNAVIKKLIKTHSKQQGLYLSVILTVFYASILLYTSMILFSYLKEIQRNINLQTQ